MVPGKGRAGARVTGRVGRGGRRGSPGAVPTWSGVPTAACPGLPCARLLSGAADTRPTPSCPQSTRLSRRLWTEPEVGSEGLRNRRGHPPCQGMPRLPPGGGMRDAGEGNFPSGAWPLFSLPPGAEPFLYQDPPPVRHPAGARPAVSPIQGAQHPGEEGHWRSWTDETAAQGSSATSPRSHGQ